MKANHDIRIKAYENDVRYWEIAKWLGMSPEAFSKLLREELDERRKAKIMQAIDEVAHMGSYR